MIEIDIILLVLSSPAVLITLTSFAIHFVSFSRLAAHYKRKHNKAPSLAAAKILKLCQLIYTSLTGLYHISRADIYLSFTHGASPNVGYVSAVARGFFLFQIYLCLYKPEIFPNERLYIGTISLLIFLGSTGVALTKRHQFHIVVIMASNAVDLIDVFMGLRFQWLQRTMQTIPIILLIYISQAHIVNSTEFGDTLSSICISLLLLASWLFRFRMKFLRGSIKDIPKSADDMA